MSFSPTPALLQSGGETPLTWVLGDVAPWGLAHDRGLVNSPICVGVAVTLPWVFPVTSY